jgi:DNA-binding winged helix-turn-helix (wHTH) protein/predicted ATPase
MSAEVEKDSDDSSLIVFSSFRLDRRSGRLTRAGVPIPLRAKTWAVLLYLAERPGVLVTREELLDAVWPGVAVTPDTLTKSIGELRRILGDDSTSPRFIETVHRRGIRFVAETSDGEAIKPTTQTGRNGDAPVQPFVGRADEFRQLGACFTRARAGERQIVFVTGSPGIGKTRLVEAFLDLPAVRSALPSVRVARGSCVEQRGPREPYMPVLEALERLVRQPESGRLVPLLRRVAPTWLAQMPWLIGDDAEALRQSLQAARAERMLREFAALAEALTTEATLVLVLEDLHWSDPSTVDLLSLLGQRREPARLLVIGIYRPVEAVVTEHALAQAVRTLQVRRQCMELPVHELTEPDVGSYLHERFPGARFPSGLARMLHRHTDGNPLFLAAVIDHMLSRGWILDTSPGWALTARLDQIDLGVPDDVRRTIAAQFDCLAPADQSLLRAASVAGTEFAVQAIAAALGWSLDDVEARCETLAHSHRFLRDAGASAWPDGPVARRYAFTHQIYRQAVYEGTSIGARQRLHQQIGEALEAAHGERATEIAGELADHFQRGRDHLRALSYLAAAAAGALRRFAHREAGEYLETAIDLAKQLSDEGERSRRELDLRITLAPILNNTYGFASEELRQNCERALVLCNAAGSPAQLFQIVYILCHVYGARSDGVLAPAMAERLDDLARRLATVEHRLLADSVLARNAVYQGRFADACRLAEGVLSARPPRSAARQLLAYGTDPVVATQDHYALGLWFLGQTDDAMVAMRAALATARSSGSVFTLAAALSHSSVLELLCRSAARGRDLAEEACTLSTEHGLAYWNATATALKGWARVQQGQARGAIEELEAALSAYQTMGVRLFYTYILAVLAEARLRIGEIGAGLAAVDDGLRAAETTLDRCWWPELWRLKGELLLAESAGGVAADSQRQAAEQSLRCALDMARKDGAKALELRAATSLARMLQGRGRATDARSLLDGVCQFFGAGAISPDLIEARALLQQP